MTVATRKQLATFGVFLVLYALLALATYLFVPFEQLMPGRTVPPPSAIPRWQLGLANAGMVLVAYGVLGCAGYWFARKLGLPGIYRAGAGWRAWVFWPLLIGLGLGAVLVVGDRLFATAGPWNGFPHPAFPFSLIASAAAGIGEEIAFRGFAMGLWAFLLNVLLRRWNGTRAALWIGNVIAALAFSAAHLPAVMLLLGVNSPAEIPPLILAEVFLLDSLLALVAGQRHMRDGLIAAMGVHFWTDIVWHVIWPVVGLAG